MLSDRTSKALAGVSKATQQKGVRVKHLFRIMTHYPDLWMQAYANIHQNKGAVTKGVNDTTLDGMSEERVSKLIMTLKKGEYQPKPVRRTYIPKKNGKLRPLGIPTGDDKLVQEVARMLLEQIYEPVFSDKSHGFRRKRSCHTALAQMSRTWKAPKWIVEVDVSGFYDNIDHDKLIETLEKKIDDRQFIRLIRSMLKAGYLDDWKFHRTYSGAPQGGICSPILANVYLNELDEFVERRTGEFTRGETRRTNKEWENLGHKIQTLRDRLKREKQRGTLLSSCLPWLKDQLAKAQRARDQMPCGDPNDEGFKRLYYVRYADDFVFGVIGAKQEAEALASEVEAFLNSELKLAISKEKSAITHVKEGFNFLGYRISMRSSNQRRTRNRSGTTKDGRTCYATYRSLNSQLRFQVPYSKVWEFCRRKRFVRGFDPIHRPELVNHSDYEIVSMYNAEMRGFVNYYALAEVSPIRVLEGYGLRSLFKTLALKHKTRSKKVRSGMKRAGEHYLSYTVKGQPRLLKVFKARHRKQGITSPDVDKLSLTHAYSAPTEILQRLSAKQCEYCGTTQGSFEVHHVRKLADIANRKQMKTWEYLMRARRRKTLVLCTECHDLLHVGRLPSWRKNAHAETESAVLGNSHAAFGGGPTSQPSSVGRGLPYITDPARWQR